MQVVLSSAQPNKIPVFATLARDVVRGYAPKWRLPALEEGVLAAAKAAVANGDAAAGGQLSALLQSRLVSDGTVAALADIARAGVWHSTR